MKEHTIRIPALEMPGEVSDGQDCQGVKWIEMIDPDGELIGSIL